MIKLKSITLKPSSRYTKKHRHVVKFVMVGKQRIGEVYCHNYVKPKIYSVYSTDPTVQAWTTGRSIDTAVGKFKIELRRAIDKNSRRLKYYMEK